MSIFSENLKKARKNKGFTQKEIAELADISQSSYSDLERGETTPMRKTKIALAKVLGNNFGDSSLDEEINRAESPRSKKEIIEESSVDEIWSIKFGGGATRRSKEEILRLKKLLDREMEKMVNES